MTTNAPVNLWTSPGHAHDYLNRADSILHRGEGESTLLEFIPKTAGRILDLGTGDGRLLALVKSMWAGREAAVGRDLDVQAVAIDFSPAMLAAAERRFGADSSVTIVAHNLDHPLPALGKFDAIISSFAIHHLVHPRKRALYAEIHAALNPGGVFCNLEHVASPTPARRVPAVHRLHRRNGRSVEQVVRPRNATGVATRNWLCRRGLSLEVAGAGSAGRAQGPGRKLQS